MKDTRPIEQQVAELTEEQKRKIPKIFYGQLIFLLVCIAVIAVLGAATGYMWYQAEKAYDEYEELSEEYEELREEYEEQGKIYLNEDMRDEVNDAWDNYDGLTDTVDLLFYVSGAALCVLIIGTIVIQVVITKKHPYYSEKKFTYLKRIKKSAQ